VVRDKEHVDVPSLWERCQRQLERSHIPDFIQVVDELPKTASEKVQTRFLVEKLDPSDRFVFTREQLGV